MTLEQSSVAYFQIILNGSYILVKKNFPNIRSKGILLEIYFVKEKVIYPNLEGWFLIERPSYYYCGPPLQYHCALLSQTNMFKPNIICLFKISE